MKTCRFQDQHGECPNIHAVPALVELFDLSAKRPGNTDYVQQLSWRAASLVGHVGPDKRQLFSPCVQPIGARKLAVATHLRRCCPDTYAQVISICKE